MAGIDNAIYDKLSKKKWYQQEFLVSGTFTARVDGIYFLTGCGGGAGGGYASPSSTSGGGGAGCFRYPVYLAAGTSVTVTIGAGGLGSANNTKNAGGDTSFGTYVVLKGASGGITSIGGLNISPESASDRNSRPIGFFFCGASGGVSITGSSIPGNSTFERGLSDGNVGGGAGGFFGVGGVRSITGTGGSAPANSGAGGGSTNASTFSGGNGGSGILIVQWQG